MPIYTNDPYDDGLFPVEPSLRSSIGIGPKVTKAIDSATKDWLDNHPEATTTVEDNSLTNAKFMDGSVNSRVIEDESITTDDIADLAVTTPKIANLAINASKIAPSAADGLRIMSITQPGVAKVGAGLAMNNGALELDGNGDIATAVTAWLDAHPEATTTVQNNSITTVKIVDNAVTDDKLDSNGLMKIVMGSTVTGKNKFDPVHIVDHAAIDNTDGSVYTVTPNSSVSTFIKIDQETHVIASYTNSSSSTSIISLTTMQVAFYDESQEFMSLESGSGSVDVPSGAAYMRVTIPSTYAPALARVMVEFGDVLTEFEPYKQTIRGDLDVIASNHESRISALEEAAVIASDLLCGIVNGTFSQIKLIGDSITQGVGGTGFNPNNSPATDYSDNSTYYGDGAVTCIDQRTSATIRFRVNDAGACWANSFKDYIEGKFSGVTVKNYGTRGLAAIHMITHGYRDEQSQFHSLIEQLIEPEDDFVICMFGTNDRKAVEGYPPYDSSVYRNYMQQIIDYVTNLGKPIAIMACIPASASAESTVPIHMDDINREVYHLAKTNNLQSVSLYNLMNQYIRYTGVELSDLLSDTLHPNDTGYDLMYKMVLEGFGFGSPYNAVVG